MPEFEYYGLGICAANEGHEGTCAEASGWDAEDVPHRVQLSRRKGWRKPENTVVVARPSKWGNPYKVNVYGRAAAVGMFRLYAVQVLNPERIRSALTGKNLACWCPLDQPCHADVLLELANGDPA